MTPEEKKKQDTALRFRMLGRLVNLSPHPRDKNGKLIPLVNLNGKIVEWPKDEKGQLVSLDKLDEMELC